MRYLSLFSGIEAATVAWEPLGWEAVAFAEIEPFPCEVLSHHYPEIPNLGSVTEITESQIKKLGPIDLVVFGSPCQDLSVAGKRKGLDGERSGLFRTAIHIIKWARKHSGCRFALWENVPGALSSNEGKDFAEVLRLHTGASQPVPEKWQNGGIAFGKAGATEWRVLDAQHFGVPQRRRRIFALTDFGDWTGRQPVLFESEGVQRDSHQGCKAGQDVAGTLASRTSGGGFPGTDEACSGYVQPVAFDMTAFGQYGPGYTASTLKQRDYKDATDLVVFEPGAVSRLRGNRCSTKLAPTLRADMGDNLPAIAFNPKDDPVHSGTVAMPLQATRHAGKRGDNQDGKGNGLGVTESGPMYTLTAGDKRAVCFQQNQRNEVRLTNGDGQVTGALAADAGMKQQNYLASSSQAELAVRRLTPVECERLQGFPDGYTAIPWRNKTPDQCPDGPRYKALGNSMAVPVMQWIGRRIEYVVNGQ